MKQLKEYSQYKDSGIKWINKIPKKWEIKKIKYLTEINKNVILETTPKNYKINYVDIGNVSYEKGIISSEVFDFKKAPSRARRIAENGDTIISTVRTYLKAIDYIDNLKSKYIFSTGFAILHPKITIFPKFLTSYIKSNAFTNQVDIYSKGMSYPAINSFDIAKLLIFLPPKQEQEQIANYLDQKTELIDKTITQKKELIKLLKERQQILINDTITKGIDKTVSMKSSNFKWLSDIPEHWEMKALKYILKERTERNKDGKESLFMMSQIHGLVIRADFHTKAIVSQDNTNHKRVYPNDLVFNKLKAHLGVFSKSEINKIGIVSPDYAVYYSIQDIPNLLYLEYLFKTPTYISHFITKATGIVEGLIRLYTDDLFNLKVPVPPIEEQNAIINFIKENNSKIDKAINLQEQQIERLVELKETLIDSCVTGKVKVP